MIFSFINRIDNKLFRPFCHKGTRQNYFIIAETKKDDTFLVAKHSGLFFIMFSRCYAFC